MSAAQKPARPTHLDPATAAEIAGHAAAFRLAAVEAAAASARAEAADARRALAFAKFCAVHGLSLATTYGEDGALTYPPAPAPDAERAEKGGAS